MPAPDDDAAWMRVALGLARRGLGRVWPNPAVGCVIVADGRVVGRGWTQPGGRPHAETEALAAAGPRARGATAYVTLEPCAHVGRTPPCAAALTGAGVARVVAPLPDPDPRVDGRGFAALRAAGVEVAVGCLAEEAAALNAGFLSRLGRGRPWLTLKLAASLDARIATASGDSRWITGPLARREVHLLRARSDAVLIGAGTARADDPRLDARDLGLAGARPVRVVVAGDLDLPTGGRLAAPAGGPLWLAHHAGAPAERRAAWTAAGAALIEAPALADGRLDPAALVRRLGERGLTRVLCEGGGRLAGALVAADLVDELVVYTAGLALGADGAPALGALGVAALATAPRFRLVDVALVGGDVRARWRRAGVFPLSAPPGRITLPERSGK
jgi:diaminohydroxyphosphoribosylaminopyrimidine deaminase/5-amino-6-(5-phosphoribosylamino)uracil reductase